MVGCRLAEIGTWQVWGQGVVCGGVRELEFPVRWTMPDDAPASPRQHAVLVSDLASSGVPGDSYP